MINFKLLKERVNNKYKNKIQIARKEDLEQQFPTSVLCATKPPRAGITGLPIIVEKEFVISISMSLPKHFVDLIFQCPSFTFLSVSGTRSLHPAGLHTAKFILYWMTNCIWICRVEGQGCSLWVSQAPSKCLSHENVLEFPLCCSPLKCSRIPNSALTWMSNNRVLP